MKIVMTLLVRNEEDIIRENIEFHLSQGVSFFIATDNLSVDRTPDILREYEEKGVLRYIFEGSNQFDQHKWVTQMAIMAFKEYGADWIINNDADEFWWPRVGGLTDAFNEIPEEFNVLEAGRTNFVMVEGASAPFYKRMIYKQAVPVNSLGRPLPSKVAHRGSGLIKIAPGNHAVSGFTNVKMKRGAIEVLHFPMRSHTQFENKIKFGGAAYERNKELPEKIGITWRKLYSEFQKHGELHDYCDQNTYGSKNIQEEITRGQIIEDRRLLDYLLRLPGLQNDWVHRD